MDSIYDRRSIRKYLPQMPERALIDEIIRAGIAAPSAKNRQPWRFVVFTEQAKTELLREMEKGLRRELEGEALLPEVRGGLADAFHTMQIMHKAPVLILVLNPDAGSPFEPQNPVSRFAEIADTLSIGAAVENMLLKAAALGLGTLWIANTCFAYPELTAYLKTDAQLVCAVSLGYPDEAPAVRPRKTPEEVTEYRA